MDKFEELKAWAEKWNISYSIKDCGTHMEILFDSQTYCDPIFSCNKETGDYIWYGGD